MVFTRLLLVPLTAYPFRRITMSKELFRTLSLIPLAAFSISAAAQLVSPRQPLVPTQTARQTGATPNRSHSSGAVSHIRPTYTGQPRVTSTYIQPTYGGTAHSATATAPGASALTSHTADAAPAAPRASLQTFRSRHTVQTEASAMPNPYTYGGWGGSTITANGQLYGSPITTDIAPPSPWVSR